MSDYEMIRNLIGRYAHYADDWETEKYASLFTADGVLVVEGIEMPVHTTNKELARKYADALRDGPQPAGFKHIQANTVIEIDGDTATAVSDLVSLRLSPDKGWTFGSGRYYDDIVRQNGEWLFRRRVVKWYRDFGQDPLDASKSASLVDSMKAAKGD